MITIETTEKKVVITVHDYNHNHDYLKIEQLFEKWRLTPRNSC